MRRRYGVRELEKEFGVLTFGRLLKSHREGEELSQVAMAKLLDISKQSLNDLESGRTLPSIARSAEIARKIGLMEATLVELALQDQIGRDKLHLYIRVEMDKKSRKVLTRILSGS